jgi:hypothetical protein
MALMLYPWQAFTQAPQLALDAQRLFVSGLMEVSAAQIIGPPKGRRVVHQIVAIDEEQLMAPTRADTNSSKSRPPQAVRKKSRPKLRRLSRRTR